VTDRWDALLAAIVQQSVARGVIPATWDLAGDGTPVERGAHSFGRTVCACPAQRCGCLRRFSDPDALLGWDSYRNRYYFGYNAVVLTVANAVPGPVAHLWVVSLALHPANRPDGLAYPDLRVKTPRRYAGTGCRLARVIGDAAFDVDALWTFTPARGVTPGFAPHTPPQPPPHLSAASSAGGVPSGTKPPRPVPRRAPRPGSWSASTAGALGTPSGACRPGPRRGTKAMPRGRRANGPTVGGQRPGSTRPGIAAGMSGTAAS
jgi:hypothetical protein